MEQTVPRKETTNSPLKDISVQICEILRYLENGKGYAKSDKNFGVVERGVELHVIKTDLHAHLKNLQQLQFSYFLLFQYRT